MRKVEVTQDLISAWETWTVRVPDECPVTEPDRSEWLRLNQDKIEWLNMTNSGFDASEITESNEVTE